MAPKMNQWANGKWGKWAKGNWNGGPGGQHKGGKVDWACGICDVEADPTYQGNYANQDFCPFCKTEKRLACHMTMETRRARIRAGTLKPKAQARAEREARQTGNPGNAAAGKDKANDIAGDAKAADNKYIAYLWQEMMAGKIDIDKMKELTAKGRPPENSSKPNSVGGQSAGDPGAGAEGATSASTQPHDVNSQWTRAGPTPSELKKNWDKRKEC